MRICVFVATKEYQTVLREPAVQHEAATPEEGSLVPVEQPLSPCKGAPMVSADAASADCLIKFRRCKC